MNKPILRIKLIHVKPVYIKPIQIQPIYIRPIYIEPILHARVSTEDCSMLQTDFRNSRHKQKHQYLGFRVKERRANSSPSTCDCQKHSLKRTGQQSRHAGVDKTTKSTR